MRTKTVDAATKSVATINRSLLMSDAEYFSDEFAINPYYESRQTVIDSTEAMAEHAAIQATLKKAGAKVVKVPAPKDCQDGVYAANWGLCRGDTCVLSVLPNKRQAEEAYAEKTLQGLGKKVVKPPYRFSGQGDALPCGDLLFIGSEYRTDPKVHQFIADHLGYEIIGLQTVPTFDKAGAPLTNTVTGWPDSFFYDIDLALAVLRDDLIAWCPEAFMPESQERILSLPIKKIAVSLEEAVTGFACNLISTGDTVVMSADAPDLTKAIEAFGLTVITPKIRILGKGGGYIRCTALTLDND